MTTSTQSPRLSDPFLGYFCFQKKKTKKTLQLKITKLGGFGVKHLFYPFEVQTYLILLHFALLHYTGVMFLQMEDKAPTSKNITIHFTEKLTNFIATLPLLRWSGNKPAVSPRLCLYTLDTPQSCDDLSLLPIFPTAPAHKALRSKLTAFPRLKSDVFHWHDWTSPLLWKFSSLS